MSFSREMERILASFPVNGENEVDFTALEQTELGSVFSDMAKTEQNREYHGEGDVYAHTKLVCNALIRMDEYRSAPLDDKRILFLAALLHDIGKVRCTRLEDGKITSPHHAATGAVMAREFLWRGLGLCGSVEAQQLREAACMLVRYHSFPPFAVHDKNAHMKLLRMASNAKLAIGFSLRKLSLLEKADTLGKIGGGNDYLEKIAYFEILAEEAGCLDSPYAFADSYSERAYFKKRLKWKEQKLFDPTWGEVFLMAGLPGTGKDTWIRENCPDIPVISLDGIRGELGVSPTDNQGPVIAEAHSRARALLRRKQPFIWNATSITAQIRGGQIDLFESYGAKVRTVFLETSFDEELRRNARRKATVPEAVIERMLGKLEMPEAFECERVEWLCV